MEIVLALPKTIKALKKSSIERVGVSNLNLSGWNWPETEKEATLKDPYWVVVVEEKMELEGRGLHAHLYGTAYLFEGKPSKSFKEWTRSTHVQYQPAR